MKILIVDDVELNRKVLRFTLRSAGLETVEAADGVEALDALHRERMDLIISDILMPRMDGYRLCQEVRKDERLRNTPFIAYTSTYTQESDARLALECGADRYLKKPAAKEKILELVRELTAKPPDHALTVRDGRTTDLAVMKEYNEALVRKLEERNAELEQARAEVARANTELEKRVQERTTELMAAIQELEAFSQSLAHDLRSPLMAIDGFIQVLIEESQDKLGEKSIKHLNYIGKATKRMSDLTDDLLRLARASRGEMRREPVDLSAMAEMILSDLRHVHPERNVEIVIEPALVVSADRSLLRIAIENLLNNAWKYSGKTELGRIEFGVRKVDGERAYFVGDNGAGFDMTQSGRLFRTFQRLHSNAEFPGTGLGLTTVQRVIRRHNGRIWAEGVVGKGAKFHFTLGPKNREEGDAA
ncbi:MAG TPA: response regulator [Chthoniobacteraceae bacterium]|jgi:signal transduction histidine kinase